MLRSLGHNLLVQRRHLSVFRCASLLLCLLLIGTACEVHAQQTDSAARSAAPTTTTQCLPAGNGYLRARLAGAMTTELNWGNDGTECTGAVRPTDGGIRMRFSRPDGPGRLVLIFGIARLEEGKDATNLPVNVTLIREGAGEFFSTLGDNKCTLDKVTQEVIVGVPRRSRSYRIVARGFCTQPARAVRGQGVVLLSRFDYAGRVDFQTEDKQTDDLLTAGKP
jgi:hypothetical protein